MGRESQIEIINRDNLFKSIEYVEFECDIKNENKFEEI